MSSRLYSICFVAETMNDWLVRNLFYIDSFVNIIIGYKY